MSKDTTADHILQAGAALLIANVFGTAFRSLLFKNSTALNILKSWKGFGIESVKNVVFIGASALGAVALFEGSQKLFGSIPSKPYSKKPTELSAVTPSPFQFPAQLSSLRPAIGALKI